jgi:hypothetical protein
VFNVHVHEAFAASDDAGADDQDCGFAAGFTVGAGHGFAGSGVAAAVAAAAVFFSAVDAAAFLVSDGARSMVRPTATAITAAAAETTVRILTARRRFSIRSAYPVAHFS